ncbi:MAG TPA: hypothetical protein VF185_01165 [Patescibacteria group bacterium]
MAFRRIRNTFKKVVTSSYAKWGITAGITLILSLLALFLIGSGIDYLSRKLQNNSSTSTTAQATAIPIPYSLPTPSPTTPPEPTKTVMINFVLTSTQSTLTASKIDVEQKITAFSQSLSEILPGVEPEIHTFYVVQQENGTFKATQDISLKIPDSIGPDIKNTDLEQIVQIALKSGAKDITLQK